MVDLLSTVWDLELNKPWQAVQHILIRSCQGLLLFAQV